MATAAEEERAEILIRLLVTTERLERVAARLEAYISTPSPPQKEKNRGRPR